jgi:hypothetical protein
MAQHHLTRRELARGFTGGAIALLASTMAVFAAAHHFAW